MEISRTGKNGGKHCQVCKKSWIFDDIYTIVFIVFHKNLCYASFVATILMRTHNIHFYGEIWKIIPKLASNTHLRAVPDEKIWGSLTAKYYTFVWVVGVGCFSIQWMVDFCEL